MINVLALGFCLGLAFASATDAFINRITWPLWSTGISLGAALINLYPAGTVFGWW